MSTSRNAVAEAGAALVLAVALASLAPGTAGVAADAAPSSHPTCHGRAATLVGHDGSTILGTSRADVIVTNDAAVVRARGGNDLICVTGTNQPGPIMRVRIYAGAGADSIDGSRTRSSVTALLGPGRDTYRGSQGSDVVFAAGGGTDHISTSFGGDLVHAGGLRGARDHDVVHLGPDGDQAIIDLDPSTRVYGEQGPDSLDLPSDHGKRLHDWVYDVRHGTYRDGVKVQSYSGFEDLTLGPPVPAAAARGKSFTITTGPDDDRVDVNAVATGVTSIDLGAGDDVLDSFTYHDRRSDPHLHYAVTGGEGRNVWNLYGGSGDPTRKAFSAYVGVDLAQQTWTLSPGVSPFGTVSGMDIINSSSYDRADLTGDDADNRFLVEGCGGTLSGGVGNDLLGLDPLTCRGTLQPVRIDGGAGQDRIDTETAAGAEISGGTGDDQIEFGGGDDAIDGGSGDDHIIIDEFSAAGDDTIDGGAGDDDIRSGTGNDTITGGPGNDTVFSDQGRDTVSGGMGDDMLAGGGGDDTLTGDDGTDSADGGFGTDSCDAETTTNCE